MISRPARQLALTLVVAGVAIACQASASATPGAEPGATQAPTSAPTAAIGNVGHASGASDLIFQFSEGGGFVPADFFPTYAPILSLYGDGTVIFRDAGAEAPFHDDLLARHAPFQTATLTEEQLQAFLSFAIADAGLGVARDSYSGPGADLPTATFFLAAAGIEKTVSVMALGMERPGDPDEQILLALARLGEKVRAFSDEVDGEVTWVPDRWRGVLEPNAVNASIPWPWPEVAPTDFVQNAGEGVPNFPIRTMTQGEVDMLGLDGLEGGVSGIPLIGPDGNAYSFALRPLLPHEER